MVRANIVVLILCVLTLAGGAAACGGPELPIGEVLQANDISTGWFDAGIENGKNKLSPSINLTVKNISNAPVTSVQLNAIFRRIGETEEWGGAYVQIVGSDGLASGASTTPILLRSQLGYTGVEPRAQMLQNKLFVDVRVQVFAKRGALQWAKLGEWPVTRELVFR
jgi:hypothetical protein